jgi:hypothetical protein
MRIDSLWNKNVLLVNAEEIVNLPPQTIVKSHISPRHGKILGTEYTNFFRHENHISCSFHQKFGPLKFLLSFEKVIERLPGKTVIHFRTVDSIVNMEGAWSVVPRGSGTLLSLRQECHVPSWAPGKLAEKVIKSRVEDIFKNLKARE